MVFRTEISTPPSLHMMDHTQIAMTIGSCFSQHIGQRLQKYKFKCISNPFGTVYNPVSIANLISRSISQQYVDSSSLESSQGIWVHPDFHSSLCSTDKMKTMTKINETIQAVGQWLKNADFLFITFGTSLAYIKKADGSIVANCHKIPSNQFEKIVISIDAGTAALRDAIDQLLKFNADLKIILTISPVRHLRDGAVENSFSKARLHGIVESLARDYKNNLAYFPAYEWMMDDLRDYRYYDADMIHPNEVAVEYIWQKFVEHMFDPQTSSLCKNIDAILRAAKHKPFNHGSSEHNNFVSQQMMAILELQKAYPYLDFSDEIKYFTKQHS